VPLGAAREIETLKESVPDQRTSAVSGVIQYFVDSEVFNTDGGSETN
jgi:hypothetical protein